MSQKHIASLLTLSLVSLLTGCGTTAAASSAVSSSAATVSTANKSTAPKHLTTVRFSEVIRSVFYAPEYVALAKGYFKKVGLNVKLVTAQASNKGAAALLAGTADISLVGPETAIFIYNQHGNQKLKVFSQLTQTDGSFLLAKKPIKKFSWSDLKGQTIVGWRPGSDPNMALGQALRQHHVSAHVLTNISPLAMVQAFETSKAQFLQEYEPVVSSLIASHKAYLVASMGKAVGTYPETAFVATSAYIKKHPKLIQAWTNAMYKAVQWTYGHSSAQVASAIASYFPGTSKKLLASSVKRYRTEKAWAKNPVMTKKEYQILEKTLIASGVLKKRAEVKYSAIVDTSFAKKA